VKDKDPVCWYIGQPTTSGLYSLPRDSHIPGGVRLMIRALRLGCAFRADRLIHTFGSYEESTIPLAYFYQPEVKFPHEVSSRSECTMNVPNYYEGNLGIVCFVRHDNQMGCLVIL